MSLPVSKYEELLQTVRNLKKQTIRVRELASPLLDTIISANTLGESSHKLYENQWTSLSFKDPEDDFIKFPAIDEYSNHQYLVSTMDSLRVNRQQCEESEDGSNLDDFNVASQSSCSASVGKYDDQGDLMYHNSTSNSAGSTWPVERVMSAGGIANMWHSDVTTLNSIRRNKNENQKSLLISPHDSVSPTDLNSVMSFASSSGAAPFELCSNTSDITTSDSEVRERQQQLDVKVDMVYSLLAVLGTSECPDMGETLLALSSSFDSSRAMRKAGCLPVLVQLVHAKDDDDGKTRQKAAQALKNLVQGQMDEKQKKKRD